MQSLRKTMHSVRNAVLLLLLLVLYVLFRLAALIVRLAWLFSGEDTMYDMTGGRAPCSANANMKRSARLFLRQTAQKLSCKNGSAT